MKKTFYGEVVGISKKSIDGYNKMTIIIMDKDYNKTKTNKRKQILVPTQNIYKYIKHNRYKFETEYQPETIKCIAGYKEFYNIKTKKDECNMVEDYDYKNMPYKAYLKTEHWKETREHMLEKYNHKCAMCDRTDNLQVHHNTYVNRGEEREEDLTVLCPICHMKEHIRIDSLMHKKFDKEYNDCQITEEENVEIERLLKLGWGYRSLVPVGNNIS